MSITVTGLVLKEVRQKEADRILSLICPQIGVVSVYARGSLRPKNKLFSASNLFCYSEWTLHEGKSMFSANEAAPIEVFFGLRQSIEAVSLASYIAEILQTLSPTGQEADALLRLSLNCFYLLSKNVVSPSVVKAVFELRALAESGFFPDIEQCYACGQEDELVYFDFENGHLLCKSCLAHRALGKNISPGVLLALRHIISAPSPKLFKFSLGDKNTAHLCHLAEKYLVYHMDYPPKTLGFLQQILL